MAAEPRDQLVEAARYMGVTDTHVLGAVRAVPRAEFVPPEYARFADDDAPIPIPHDQTTSQPSLCAGVVAALGLTGNEHVLEIGTGYGYQAALLAHVAGFVTTIERWSGLADQARRNLGRVGIENVRVLARDGTEGAPEHAPYAAVVVSAAFPEVPRPLVDQLRQSGRLVQPVGPGGAEELVVFERTRDDLTERATLGPASFVRLYGQHGYPS